MGGGAGSFFGASTSHKKSASGEAGGGDGEESRLRRDGLFDVDSERVLDATDPLGWERLPLRELLRSRPLPGARRRAFFELDQVLVRSFSAGDRRRKREGELGEGADGRLGPEMPLVLRVEARLEVSGARALVERQAHPPFGVFAIADNRARQRR